MSVRIKGAYIEAIRASVDTLSLVPRRSTHGGKQRLVTLLDFLGPNTFRARNLSSPIRLQHCPSLIKLRMLPFATSPVGGASGHETSHLLLYFPDVAKGSMCSLIKDGQCCNLIGELKFRA